jgi:hypothetical protein
MIFISKTTNDIEAKPRDIGRYNCMVLLCHRVYFSEKYFNYNNSMTETV